MGAIKDVYTLEKAVNDYMERHNLELKHSFRNIDYSYYNVTTMDFKLLEARIIPMKNEKSKIVFKVDGKLSSIYK